MKIASIFLVATLLAGGVPAVGVASQVNVEYTVSGTAGNWTLDFGVENNIASTNNGLAITEFAVSVPGADPPFFLAPPGWSILFPGITEGTTTYGEAAVPNVNEPGIAFGSTQSGFSVHDTQAAAPTNILWYAIASSAGNTSTFTGPAGENVQSTKSLTSPNFAGTDVAPVPLPAAGWLLLSGMGGFGLLTRRRKTTARPSKAA